MQRISASSLVRETGTVQKRQGSFRASGTLGCEKARGRET